MAKMKTTKDSNKSDNLNTTPLAIFWRRHRVKFGNLFLLSLCLFLFSGCMVTESMPKYPKATTVTTTVKPTTTTTVCQVCKISNATQESKELMICNAKVLDLQNKSKDVTYYVNKLRTFRNQSDYYYTQINNTYTDLLNYSKQNYTNVGNKSYYMSRQECDTRSKARITGAVTLLGSMLIRIGGMSNR